MSDKPKILFVDDEVNILNALQRMLRNERFDITATSSPFEALHMLTQQPYSVLVSDYMMPLMTGTELLEKAKSASPKTMRILLTAHADLQVSIEAINRSGIFKLLTKPWQEDELKLTLRQAVSQYHMVEETHRQEAAVAQPAQQNQQAKNQEMQSQLFAKRVVDQFKEIYQLNRTLEENQKTALKALLKIAQMHNKVVWLHSQRVYEICKQLTKELNLPQEERFQIEVAALLHDIGLIGIPAEILRKTPEQMTPAEKLLYESHVSQGNALLSMYPHMEPVAGIIACHHEHYDGTGYPEALPGVDIPLGARLLSIADAFDELCFPVNGDERMPYDKARAVIEGEAGTRFDPMLVTLLRKITPPDDESLLGTERDGDGAAAGGWTDLVNMIGEASDKANATQTGGATPGNGAQPPGAPPGGMLQPSLDIRHPERLEGKLSDFSVEKGFIQTSAITMGMVLAEDLSGREGDILCPKGAAVDEAILAQIHKLMERGELPRLVQVFK